MNPTANDALQVMLRHGLPGGEPLRLRAEGVVHAVWRVGDYVVRILKDEEYREDTLTEAMAAPLAHRQGVTMAEPIAFEVHAALPYSILRWVEGQRLSDAQWLRDPHRFFFHLGEELLRLHEGAALLDGVPNLDAAWTIEEEFELGIADLPEDERRWAERRLAKRQTVLPLSRFAHQDLHADNLMVSVDGRPVLLDWGDAGLGDGACDFRYIPARYLESALAGYRSVSTDLRVQIARHQIAQRAYARLHGADYGPFGRSTFGEIAGWVESWC